MNGKVTEEIIKQAFRATIEANVERLYEDFKLRFMSSVNTPQVRTLTAPAPMPVRTRTPSRRMRSTNKGFTRMYDEFMSGRLTKRWTRSEQHYVCKAFATDLPWKKGIQLLLALDSLRRRYEDPAKKPYVKPYGHNILRLAIADLVKLLEKLKGASDDLAEAMNEDLDNAGMTLIDAVITYNNDCKTVDPAWPTRYAPSYPGRELFTIARNGGEDIDTSFLSDDSLGEESERINTRSSRTLERLGL